MRDAQLMLQEELHERPDDLDVEVIALDKQDFFGDIESSSLSTAERGSADSLAAPPRVTAPESGAIVGRPFRVVNGVSTSSASLSP